MGGRSFDCGGCGALIGGNSHLGQRSRTDNLVAHPRSEKQERVRAESEVICGGENAASNKRKEAARDPDRQRYCLSQTETTEALLPSGASSVMVSSSPSFDTARFDVRITLPFCL